MVSKKGVRVKGHRWERQVVSDLKDIGYDAKRILEYQSFAAMGTDVKTKGFNFQCKKGIYINPRAAYKEMQEKDQINVVVANWDRDIALACLKWEDFKTILEWLKDKRVL